MSKIINALRKRTAFVGTVLDYKVYTTPTCNLQGGLCVVISAVRTRHLVANRHIS